MDTGALPRLSRSTDWADLHLPPDLLAFLSEISPSPYEFLETPLPSLFERGVKRMDVMAVLRRVAAIQQPRADLPARADRPEQSMLFPQVPPRKTWADLHVPLDAMERIGAVAQKPQDLGGKPMAELEALGLTPQAIRAILRNLPPPGSKPAGPYAGLLYGSETVFSEELQQWLDSGTPVPREILSKRLPGLPAGGWRMVSGLHPATRAMLGKVFSRHADAAEAQFLQYNLGDLIRRGATWEMVGDAVRQIEDAGRRKWPPLDQVTRLSVTRAAKALITDPNSARITARDVRFGAPIRHIASEAATARDVGLLTQSMSCSGGVLPRRLDLVCSLHRLVRNAPSMLLEAELGDIVAHAVGPACASVVITALGWGGNPAQSRQETAGNGRSTTRWVSMVLRQFRAAIADRNVFSPALEHALAVASGLPDADVPTALRDRRCSDAAFEAESPRKPRAIFRGGGGGLRGLLLRTIEREVSG